jgi:hypothetical protein
MTNITRQVAELPFFLNRVDLAARQLRRKSHNVVTLTALRGAVVCFSEGIGGVRYGVKPVAVDPSRTPALARGAVAWFAKLVEKIGPALEGNRDQLVTSGPAVLAALGALGHGVEVKPESERPGFIAAQLSKLDNVKWERTAWEGIAGKKTPKGKITLGGSKEVAYSVYAALTDATSPGYSQVRQ